jgi:hypothetical protein
MASHTALRGCERHAHPLWDDLALKDWALRIGRRSTMREARVAIARRLAILMHRAGTEFQGL